MKIIMLVLVFLFLSISVLSSQDAVVFRYSSDPICIQAQSDVELKHVSVEHRWDEEEATARGDGGWGYNVRSTSLFDHDSLSVSKSGLGVYMQCPYRYKHEKILRTPSSGSSIPLDLGTSVHDTIDALAKEDPENIPTKETYNGNVSSIEDRSCYDEGKRVGETLCYFYKIKQKVKCSIFRPFNIFGPGMPKNDYRVFPRFFNSIKKKQPITIFKSGKQTRTFCYVTDAITAMFLVTINGKKFVYNIGNDKPELNMKKLHQLMQKSLNKKIKSINIEYPNNYPQVEPQRRCPNITKLKKEFNFKNKVSIMESIKRFYHWSSKYY